MILYGLEGLLKGESINLEEKDEWIIGRDPDQCNFVIEDSACSRKHGHILKTDEGYLLKNLSETNPIEVNDDAIDSYILKEGDKIKIGNTIFLFTDIEKDEIEEIFEDKEEEIYDEINEKPEEKEIDEEITEETEKEEEKDKTVHRYKDKDKEEETIYEEPVEELPFGLIQDSPYILKVISGPNAGAEFGMEKSRSYVIGKDPNVADIIFTDLSVSKQNSAISIDEDGNIFLEDLKSKNGTYVNNVQIKEKTNLTPQDLISVGTTTFLIVSKEEAQETIYSPAPTFEVLKEEEETLDKEEKKEELSIWKKQFIPTKHLIYAGSFLIIVFVIFLSFFALFKGHDIEIKEKEPVSEIAKIIEKHADIEFSFNPSSANLFIVGHILTYIDKEELMHNLHQLTFIETIEDNVIVDESVVKDFNDTLSDIKEFKSVSLHTPKAGLFVLQGYVDDAVNFENLTDYVNSNFSYLDKLENNVVILKILQTQIATDLIKNNFSGITFEIISGELVLSGRYDKNNASNFKTMLEEFEKTPGIHYVKNLAIPATEMTSRIDLSSRYKITGYASYDGTNFSVLANGKIVNLGDNLDGMLITKITTDTILLEKDDLKYKINYSR
ncbi:MAG: type III secretion system inner membrane ring subunit SctD [Parachlamydiales bacterium]|nr:type III secretion system inner membrane ring subunit SctD [Parachlamydiales bacterium]